MIECPKCGFKQPPGLECPACGIVFAKFSPPSQEAPETKDETAHTWEGAWFPDEDEKQRTPPLRMLTLLLLLALVTVAAYLEYSRHTEAFEIAENAVLGVKEIRTDLGADRGDELRVGYFFRGQARNRGSGGQGRFLFRVIGPAGEGSALVHLMRREDLWQAIQVDFQGPRGRTRSLEVQAPKERPARPDTPAEDPERDLPVASSTDPPEAPEPSAPAASDP